MAEIKASGKPKCPNHGAYLEGLGFPMKSKGTGMCPISGASFEYEVDLDEATYKEVLDKNGNITKVPQWKLTGEEK